MSSASFTSNVPAANGGLPAPEENSEADVVIYDGNCRFCQAQVRRLARLDSRRLLTFISLHDPEVARRWPDLTREQLMEQMYLVDQQGRRHAGAAAFRYLSRRLWRLWPLCPVLHVPGSMLLGNRLYRWIAQRRYKIAGQQACDEGGTCHVHFKS
jgi:predicted DCC family thiol-disulfide oxidoreductase YuxK